MVGTAPPIRVHQATGNTQSQEVDVHQPDEGFKLTRREMLLTNQTGTEVVKRT